MTAADLSHRSRRHARPGTEPARPSRRARHRRLDDCRPRDGRDAEPPRARSSAARSTARLQGVVEITVDAARATMLGRRRRRSRPRARASSTTRRATSSRTSTSSTAPPRCASASGTARPTGATVVGTDPSTDLAVIKVDAPASMLEAAPARRLERARGRRRRGRDRQPVRPRGDASRPASSAPCTGRCGRRTASRSTTRSRPTPRSTTATPAARSSTSSAQVIGVNAQIESDSGGNDGVGFAIPSNTVKSIAPELIESGEVEHAYLGVGARRRFPPSVADQLGTVAGAAVAEVRGGTPAAKAGLRRRPARRRSTDRTVPDRRRRDHGGRRPDDHELRTSSSAAIDAKKPGDTISITYWRNGDSHTVNVKLATRPEEGVR